MVYGLFHFVLSPVNGLFATVARGTCRELDTSNAMPGPHAFSVRNKALSSEAPLASTASCPASVTISSRPSGGQDQIAILLLLPSRQAKFLKFRNLVVAGQTAELPNCPSGEISRPGLRGVAAR